MSGDYQIAEEIKTCKDITELEAFCIAPFVGLRQQVTGTTGCCHMGGGELNTKGWPAERVWKESLHSLRKEFLQNKFPKSSQDQSCHRCKLEESFGKVSARMMNNQINKDALSKVLDGSYLDGPRTIIFQPNNTCNLACRTCQAVDTNQYEEEGKFYAKTYGETDSVYILKNQIEHETEETLLDFLSISNNLKKIEFFGGEPMLNKSQKAYLQALVDRGQSGDIEISYSTNGNVFPTQELVRIWKHFKRINIQFSIDGINERFEYMRHKGKWEKLNANIDRYFDVVAPQLKQGGCSFTNTICVTISSLNIFYVKEIYAWLRQRFGEHIYIYASLVQRPSYYSAKNLPSEVRQKLVQRLRSSGDEFEDLCRFIGDDSNEDKQAFQDFLKWTYYKDKYRNQSFEKDFPDYYSWLSRYFKFWIMKNSLKEYVSTWTSKIFFKTKELE